MADVMKWQVRPGPGTSAVQTYNSGQGPISSPISVDEAGYKAAGSQQSVVYYNGQNIQTGVYRVVGVADPSLTIKPGDYVASILGSPFPFADQLGLKSPSQWSNMFWQAVTPANQNPNLPPGPGNDPNVPPGQNPPQTPPPPLPPGAVGRDQYGRAVDQYGRVIPEYPAGVYVPPPPPVETKPALGIDPSLFLMLSQQSSAAAERAAAREDAAARAEQAAQDRADARDAQERREAKAEKAELELRRQRQEQELALQRAQYQAQGIQVSPPPQSTPTRRRRRRRSDDE